MLITRSLIRSIESLNLHALLAHSVLFEIEQAKQARDAHLVIEFRKIHKHYDIIIFIIGIEINNIITR